MRKDLIVVAGTPEDQATALAVANGCVGFYQGIPQSMLALSEEQGWTLPCVVEEDDEGNVVSWAPVA